MTKPLIPEDLLDRVAIVTGHNYDYASAAILEIAKWLEEDNTLTGAKCAFMLEQQVGPKDYTMRHHD